MLSFARYVTDFLSVDFPSSKLKVTKHAAFLKPDPHEFLCWLCVKLPLRPIDIFKPSPPDLVIHQSLVVEHTSMAYRSQTILLCITKMAYNVLLCKF